MKTIVKKLGISVLALLLVNMALMSAVSAENNNEKLPPLEFSNSYKYKTINKELSPVIDEYVHTIPIGSIIYHSNGITTVFTSDGKHYLSTIDAQAEMLQTPKGFMAATHVHQIPSGSDIITRGNVTKVYHNEINILTVVNQETVDTIPEFNGWIESTSDWTVNQLYRFDAYWKVPSSPPNPEIDTVDFLFSGIEPSDGSAIIQPVLEWNNRGSGRWTGSAWSVTAADAFHSTPINVDTSDEMRGSMYWNTFQNKWFIGVWDTTTNAVTSIYSNAIGTSNLAVFTALEGYGLDDDTDVPGDTAFYSMVFKDSNNNNVDITWDPWINPTASDYLTGLNVEVFSDAEVKLHTAN